jgi:uncharacterized protein (DUF58 family)
MPVPRYRSFSPADAAAMNRLELTARHVVDGLIGGQHRSPHRGFSIEFSEHRNYVAGDDLKHLDWRAFARSDRYYIKLYEQETNLRATLLVDCSASMQFAGKLEYAKHLAACLAYLLSTQQDHSGLVAIDEAVRVEIEPGSSATHLDRLFRALDALAPGSQTALPRQMHALAERLPRRSLLIVLSDLWTDDGLLAALQHLRHRRHQAMVLHLLDRAELDLPYEKHVTLEDLESGERLQIDPRDLRDRYRANVADHLAAVRRACSDCDVEYHDLLVDVPYDRALVRLLTRRSRA